MKHCADHKELFTKIRNLQILLYIAIGTGVVNLVLPEGAFSQLGGSLLLITLVFAFAVDTVRKEGATAN